MLEESQLNRKRKRKRCIYSQEAWFEKHSHAYMKKDESHAIGIGFDEMSGERFIVDNGCHKRRTYSLYELAEHGTYPSRVYEFDIVF